MIEQLKHLNLRSRREWLKAAGATEVREPQDEPWGERRAVFRDLDGHTLQVAQKL